MRPTAKGLPPNIWSETQARRSTQLDALAFSRGVSSSRSSARMIPVIRLGPEFANVVAELQNRRSDRPGRSRNR
ncbi:MAG: hypothetical protein IPP45_16210 [Sphingomonadales bacterium]|nr:hypothetical protein [Sphingomonadales bacterium]